MERSEIEKKVADIIVTHLGVDAKDVTPETNIIDDLGADSLDIVELVMALEEDFGVEIPDDEADKFENVKNVVDFIEQAQ